MLTEVFFQLFLAVFLGGIVGLERELKKKQAGLQTYSLVCLGSCIFTILAFYLFNNFSLKSGISFDPSRIVQAVSIGIGFIGAGVVFFRGENRVEGLTTAAGLWVVAAIGIAVGVELYILAVCSALLTFGILAGLGLLEERLFHKH